MNERDIFLAALEIEDPAQRSAYLQTACAGDAALRERVEELLRSHAFAGSFLVQPAVKPVPGGPSLEEQRASFPFLDPPGRPGALGRLGHYEVLELVGRGAMGIVFRAFDDQLHRVVALKVLAPELASNPMARQRFIREARAAAAISHEHVVTIHAVDEQRMPPFLVMQFVAGVSLQDKLVLSGPLSLREILRIGSQIADGLAAAHRQGLVHRDIKPANILLENGVERVKITDFGLARAVDDVGITQTGIVPGTPQFMSPEQARGDSIDHRSDLFSLGGVLYTLCTGRPPFRADSTLAVLKRVCDDAPRPISEINPEIPGWLIAIIERLLAKDPANRLSSAGELGDLLRSHLADVQQAGAPRRTMPPVPAASRPLREPNIVPRARLVPWLATFNLFMALALMFLTSFEDPEEISPFWQTWALIDNALAYVMSVALFAASIGLYLWKPWARKLMVIVCIYGLASMAIDMPYMGRSAIPQVAAEIRADLIESSPSMSAEDVEDATVLIVGTIVGTFLVFGLVWLISQLVYFTRPGVVAAFESSPAPHGAAQGLPAASLSAWPVAVSILLAVSLLCCCPLLLAGGGVSLYWLSVVESPDYAPAPAMPVGEGSPPKAIPPSDMPPTDTPPTDTPPAENLEPEGMRDPAYKEEINPPPQPALTNQ